MSGNDEFYIGWLEEAPGSLKHLRKIFFLYVISFALVFVTTYSFIENKFIESRFDYGNLTELKGRVVQYPVFGLRTTIDAKLVTVPLVGFGKFDALPVLEQLELQAGPQSLDHFEATLKGTIIQYKEKVWMELTEGEHSIVKLEPISKAVNQTVQSIGKKMISGEIVDPKYFFGVMNPAYNKIHRSCAIRCISGGVPPVLAVRKNGDFVDYYFMIDELGLPVNKEILQFVGTPVNVQGQVEQVDDWKVIKIDLQDQAAISMDYTGEVAICQLALY